LKNFVLNLTFSQTYHGYPPMMKGSENRLRSLL
jgi:hypothetical protein